MNTISISLLVLMYNQYFHIFIIKYNVLLSSKEIKQITMFNNELLDFMACYSLSIYLLSRSSIHYYLVFFMFSKIIGLN